MPARFDLTQTRPRGRVSRAASFPYDKPISYGEPERYQSTPGGGGASLRAPLVPRDTEHTAWDMDEAGSPTLISRGGSSNIGSSVPGMGGPWAAAARAVAVSDDELDKAADEDEPYETREEIPSPHFSDTTDESIEDLIAALDGPTDVMPPVVRAAGMLAKRSEPDIVAVSIEPLSKRSIWDEIPIGR